MALVNLYSACRANRAHLGDGILLYGHGSKFLTNEEFLESYCRVPQQVLRDLLDLAREENPAYYWNGVYCRKVELPLLVATKSAGFPSKHLFRQPRYTTRKGVVRNRKDR